MNNNQQNFSEDEKLKNELELVKLKLEVESGAIIQLSKNDKIPTKTELAWFNHIYHYEKMCKDAGYSKIFEVIGSPLYFSEHVLPNSQVGIEFNRLMELLNKNGIDLSFLEDTYDERILYKFITEELFLEEISLYRGPEGDSFSCFSYEEFHPNHTHDLKTNTLEFLSQVFSESEWNYEFLKYTHESEMLLNSKQVSLKEYYNCINRFKKHYPAYLFSNLQIKTVEFDLETSKAEVKGIVTMTQRTLPYTIRFNFSYSLWVIAEVEMALFSEEL